MLILVTRPQPQAAQWAEALRALGEQAAALPLIDISAPAQPQAVADAWQSLTSTRLVMFVSPNAATWFARLRPTDATWPVGTLAAAPGPGTAKTVQEVLGAAGLGAEQLISPPMESAQFDSEHLWPLLQPLRWQDEQVLIISGGDQAEARGRAWLSDQLQAAGATVKPVLTYQRQPAQWDAQAQDLARRAHQAPADHLWLLSSSEAVDNLLQSQGRPVQGAQALVTHPKVAEKALEAGFSTVITTRPTPEAVVQARRSMPSAGA